MAKLRRERVPSWKMRAIDEETATRPQKRRRGRPKSPSHISQCATADATTKIEISKGHISTKGQIRKISGKAFLKSQPDLPTPHPMQRGSKVSNVTTVDNKILRVDRSGGNQTRYNNQKASKGVALEEESDIDDTPEELTACCLDVEDFANPIYIYTCIKRPEYVAGHLSNWESHKEIDGVIKNDNKQFYDHEGIPRDAIYILLAENMIYEPTGSVMFFATKSENGAYCLKVGFYYSYNVASNSDPRVYSLKEWCDEESRCGWPILQYEEAIRSAYDPFRFKQVYQSMAKAVDAEMHARKYGPGMRNLMGQKRARPFRTRAPVVDQ
jgi:hypothetical protein